MNTPTFGSASEEPRRYKVRFPDPEIYAAARAQESPLLYVPVENDKRWFISVQARTVLPRGRRADLPSLDALLEVYQHGFGAEIVEDRRYDLDRFELPVVEATDRAPSLDDVLEAIKVPQAWSYSRGDGATIAIVDTGISGSRPEFPRAKRRGEWAPIGEDAWDDYLGHGTMAACIAAATRANGGEFDGVAPDAGLISCRTHFFDSELTSIYDYLGDLAAESSRPLIASNSFGIRSATPPGVSGDDDFPSALADAIERGLLVCFSAGNNHELVGGAPDTCEPTSIWSYKCRDDVLVVAATTMEDDMWFYSSRGPGQHAGEPGMGPKPDLSAPSPAGGRVLWGREVKSFPDGWGTSGSCPQAAGLLALMANLRPVGRKELFDAIRVSARSIGFPPSCQGSGVLDCENALQQQS